MTAFVYGKLDPHMEETHPRVKLVDHLIATDVPEVVDYASKVMSWPEYGNLTIGDCTCAALGHAVQAWTTYGKGETVTLPESAIVALYEAVSGYDPETGANANRGAVEQDVLTYVQAHGIGGHKIRAFAQVNHKDLQEMKMALDLFGSVYVGFMVPQSAEGQFHAGQVWTPAPGSPIMGGHAIDIQRMDAGYIWGVTWGKLQAMTPEFWLTYGDEAWVILTEDWINDHTGLTPTGLSLQGLLAEFDELYGTPHSPRHAASKPGFMTWLKRLIT